MQWVKDINCEVGLSLFNIGDNLDEAQTLSYQCTMVERAVMVSKQIVNIAGTEDSSQGRRNRGERGTPMFSFGGRGTPKNPGFQQKLLKPYLSQQSFICILKKANNS